MKILLALVLLVMVEIALFIQVGDWLGLWPTLGLVILSAVGGITVVRHQGLNALNDLRRAGENFDDPTQPIAHGALILLAGFLLLTPGFFTDIIGILLLIPPLRRAMLRSVGRKVTVSRFRSGPLGDPRMREPHRSGIVIDGDFEELDPEERPPHGKSGWTQP